MREEERRVVLSTLHVYLLGDFRLAYGGEPVGGVDTARIVLPLHPAYRRGQSGIYA